MGVLGRVDQAKPTLAGALHRERVPEQVTEYLAEKGNNAAMRSMFWIPACESAPFTRNVGGFADILGLTYNCVIGPFALCPAVRSK